MSKGTEDKMTRVSEQRRQVVEQIVADMETFGGEWSKPWIELAAPRNGVSNLPYRGGNRLHLMAVAMNRGYSDSRWVTFNQAKKLGWKLRKGEKSAIVEKWKMMAIFKTDEETGETVQKGSYPKLVGYWSVFNAEQFDGVPADGEPEACLLYTSPK